MSFLELSKGRRAKAAKTSHFSIASRKLADASITLHKPTAQEILADLRERVRTECFSPLSDGPIVRAKLLPHPVSLDRQAERMARFIEQVELSDRVENL